MAISAKVNFFFNHNRWGWTETYYYQNGSGSLAGALADAIILAQARALMTSASVRLEAVRASDLTSARSAKTVFATNINAGVNTLASQEPWEAGLISLDGTGTDGFTYSRKLMLRGFPSTWNTWNSANLLNPTLPPAFASALTAFFNILKNVSGTAGLWCVRGSDRAPLTNPRYPVITVATTQPGDFFTVNLGSVPAPPIAQGERVHVSGARGAGTKGLNADAYVTGNLAGALTLSTRQKCPTATIDLSGQPVLYRRKYGLVPISFCVFERFVKRDTGRPFFGTVGRRGSSRC